MKYYYTATCHADRRLDFDHDDLGQFMKMAWLVTKKFHLEKTIPPSSWTFEGGGVELDPVDDLGLDPTLFE